MTAMSRIPAKTLMLNMALGAAFCLAAAGGAQAATWSTTSMPWLTYPGQEPAGPLPQTIAIGPAAWSYAARSQMVDVFGRDQPVILRVVLQVKTGSVGVAMANFDGSNLLSKEAALKPADHDAEVYFRVRPGGPPGFLLLRNYDAPGQAGAVLLKRVQFIREGELTTEELSEILPKVLP
jgi:hypothetical protein